MEQVTLLNQSLAIPFVIFGLLIFLVIALKQLLFPRLFRQSIQSTPSQNVKVVMTGPMGSGKTRLWSCLAYGTNKIETVTSMIENKITVNFQNQWELDEKETRDSNGPPICLVDTPGHPRLSCRSLACNLPDATGIIFVINSQVGLSGKGLRETSRALELVLSLLQLLHHQKPNSPLPQLLINITNPSQSPNLSKSTLIEKTKVSLIKELNRRQLNPSAPSNTRTRMKKSRLESLDEIPSSEFTSFYDIIMRFLKFGQSSNLIGKEKTGQIHLPAEETEVTKLLEEEEDNLTAEEKLLDPLNRYQKLSGHSLHWSVSGIEDENKIDSIKKWIRCLMDL